MSGGGGGGVARRGRRIEPALRRGGGVAQIAHLNTQVVGDRQPFAGGIADHAVQLRGLVMAVPRLHGALAVDLVLVVVCPPG